MTNEKDKKANDKHGKAVLHLSINDKRYDWHQEFITGAEIRKLGNIPADDEIFLAIKKPWKDEPIPNDKEVNLARPEVEHFYSNEKLFKVVLMVNLEANPWSVKMITFEQVIVLAYESYDGNENKGYTVTYDRGPHQNPEGTMVKGERVFVKDKMIFNVKQTGKS